MLKKMSLYVMSALYIIAGLNHFRTPDYYTRIIPEYLLFPVFLTFFSGICEVLLGIFLIPVKTRRAAAWLIIAMLNVFFIIHVQMIIDFSRQEDPLLWLAVARIPFQFALIWWAWTYTKKTSTAE
ncbi:MAG: DoxX family protein [Bacteroidia bacterium]